MEQKEHWEQVYSSRSTDDLSWYQEHAEQSLRLIAATGLARNAPIIDVGGGASTLVDDLIEHGYEDLTVLDLSAAALASAKMRLGARAARVRWIESDVLAAPLAGARFDLWHDRAVFHFLTRPEERRAYVETVLRLVRPGGHVIVATFAKDGPERCSGLPVVRYDAGSLHAEFGDQFALLHQEGERHRTPRGQVQSFVYCYCRVARLASAG
jgi:SAM-dependent methyltransferase